MHIIGTDNNN